jgi:hypothetical protein
MSMASAFLVVTFVFSKPDYRVLKRQQSPRPTIKPPKCCEIYEWLQCESRIKARGGSVNVSSEPVVHLPDCGSSVLCYSAEGRFEPIVTDAARCTSVSFADLVPPQRKRRTRVE